MTIECPHREYHNRLAERRGLARRLGIKGSNIDFLGIKRWWNEVWIPFGPGIRNNAENQLSLFFSPFADPLLSLPAYGNISHLGPSVRFEAEMIRRIAPDLARIHSSYGYSFDRIPATDRWFSYVRYGLKRPQTILRQLSPRHHPALLQGKPDGSQDYAMLVGELLREAYSLELPINRKFLDTAEPCFYRMVDLGYFVRQNRQRIVGIT